MNVTLSRIWSKRPHTNNRMQLALWQLTRLFLFSFIHSINISVTVYLLWCSFNSQPNNSKMRIVFHDISRSDTHTQNKNTSLLSSCHVTPLWIPLASLAAKSKRMFFFSLHFIINYFFFYFFLETTFAWLQPAAKCHEFLEIESNDMNKSVARKIHGNFHFYDAL